MHFLKALFQLSCVLEHVEVKLWLSGLMVHLHPADEFPGGPGSGLPAPAAQQWQQRGSQ